MEQTQAQTQTQIPKQNRNLLIITVAALVILTALLALVLGVGRYRSRTNNLSDDNTEVNTEDLNPEEDFSDFGLEEVDPELNLSVEEEVQYTIDGIDSLLEDLDGEDFADFDSVNW